MVTTVLQAGQDSSRKFFTTTKHLLNYLFIVNVLTTIQTCVLGWRLALNDRIFLIVMLVIVLINTFITITCYLYKCKTHSNVLQALLFSCLITMPLKRIAHNDAYRLLLFKILELTQYFFYIPMTYLIFYYFSKRFYFYNSLTTIQTQAAYDFDYFFLIFFYVYLSINSMVNILLVNRHMLREQLFPFNTASYKHLVRLDILFQFIFRFFFYQTRTFSILLVLLTFENAYYPLVVSYWLVCFLVFFIMSFFTYPALRPNEKFGQRLCNLLAIFYRTWKMIVDFDENFFHLKLRKNNKMPSNAVVDPIDNNYSSNSDNSSNSSSESTTVYNFKIFQFFFKINSFKMKIVGFLTFVIGSNTIFAYFWYYYSMFNNHNNNNQNSSNMYDDGSLVFLLTSQFNNSILMKQQELIKFKQIMLVVICGSTLLFSLSYHIYYNYYYDYNEINKLHKQSTTDNLTRADQLQVKDNIDHTSQRHTSLIYSDARRSDTIGYFTATSTASSSNSSASNCFTTKSSSTLPELKANGLHVDYETSSGIVTSESSTISQSYAKQFVDNYGRANIANMTNTTHFTNFNLSIHNETTKVNQSFYDKVYNWFGKTNPIQMQSRHQVQASQQSAIYENIADLYCLKHQQSSSDYTFVI